MLSLARNIPQANSSLKAGKWERNKFTGTQLEGKTLGVIGLGRVGLAVARRARGYDMKVVGYDPFMTTERAAELGIESVANLDDLWPQCDFITLHTPLSAETRNVIDARALERMRSGVRIINCARGGLIDEAALLDALNSGKVAGAAIDVFEPEPPPADHPLIVHPKTVVTPHLGASTEEAQVAVSEEAARLLIDFFRRGQVKFSVNLPNLNRAELEDLGMYLELGRRLGMLHAQMDRGSPKSATLRYRGEVAHKNTRLITASFAAGWLESALEAGQVNLVNAEILLRERGIQITEEVSTDTGDFGTMIQAEVATDRKTYIAAGTLFGRRYLRLVRLGEFLMETPLDGNLMIFSHNDRPGVIGAIGTIFGRQGVNIAHMSVGRQRIAGKTVGGEAIGVVNLDAAPSPEAIAAVESHADVVSVSLIKLPEEGSLAPWLAN